jgi:hypothetical protein
MGKKGGKTKQKKKKGKKQDSPEKSEPEPVAISIPLDYEETKAPPNIDLLQFFNSQQKKAFNEKSFILEQ